MKFKTAMMASTLAAALFLTDRGLSGLAAFYQK